MANLSLIVAVDREFGFGKDGKIPWHCPEDLKYFKLVTNDSVVIMGRNTYEDLTSYFKGKTTLLPGRTCIVVTSRPLDNPYHNVSTTSSLETAIDMAKEMTTGNVFLIGGESIYKEGIKYVNTLYITIMPDIYHCDRFFPKEELSRFTRSTELVSLKTTELRFVTLRRVQE